MGGVPEESEEEKRARKAAERRARRDRILQNRDLLSDRTASLRRQFGLVSGNVGGRPSFLGPASVGLRTLGAGFLLQGARQFARQRDSGSDG